MSLDEVDADARQIGDATVLRGSEEDVAGLGWAHLVGTAVTDDGIGETPNEYLNQVATDDRLRTVLHVRRVQTRSNLAQFALFFQFGDALRGG